MAGATLAQLHAATRESLRELAELQGGLADAAADRYAAGPADE